MGFYYAAERKRFEQEWTKLRKEYEEAGMSSETIRLLYEFDLEFFRSQRTYENHTQVMPSEYVSDDSVNHSTLFRKIANSTVTFDETDFYGRYAWVDAIEDPQLAFLLPKLSNADLELLTFLVLEEHSQQELAQKWGWSQKAVSRRFLKIKKFLGSKK